MATDWHNYIYTGALCIVLVIIGFFFFFFMPSSTVFYNKPGPDWSAMYGVLLAEVIDHGDPIVPIYGRDTSGELVITDKFPLLYEKIREIPDVYYAGLINLKPEFVSATIHGYAPVANQTLRLFYPFKVSGTRRSGVVVDGQRKFFAEGTWICADVSRENSIFNNSSYDACVILFIDVMRDVALGVSQNYDIKTDHILRAF
jgi:hypothetical protein